MVGLMLLASCSDDKVEANFREPWQRYAEVPLAESAKSAQLRQDFFAQTGSYLLFNDTIQHYSLGRDRYGNEQWFTETIDLTYAVGAQASAVTKYRYTFLQDDAEKEAAVAFLKSYILPHFTGNIRPYTWLLAKTITHRDNFGTFNDYGAIGQETAAMACELLPTLSDANKERYAAQVINLLTGRLILNNSSAFADFFAVCEDLYAQKFAESTISINENNQRLWEAGFITRGKDPDLSAVSNGFYPDRETDLTSFCRAAISSSEEKLQQTYADYPIVLRKFQLARATMERIGYVFDIQQ